MARRSVRFQKGDDARVPECDAVGFHGEAEFGDVEFPITSRALAELLNPGLNKVDPDGAIGTFLEFEREIHGLKSSNSRRGLAANHRSC